MFLHVYCLHENNYSRVADAIRLRSLLGHIIGPLRTVLLPLGHAPGPLGTVLHIIHPQMLVPPLDRSLGLCRPVRYG